MKHFYIFDLLKNLGHKKNFCAILYLILNVALVCTVFFVLSDGTPTAILVGCAVYLVAVFVALSPLGEWILRLTQGCKKIEDTTVLSRLEPIFFEAVERAQAKHPEIPIDPRITLFMKEDPSANAFAVGRRTVCVTSGLLDCSDDEIKGIFGHELGHLATHDTDLVLLITVGNFLVAGIVTVFRLLILLYKAVFSIFAMFLGGEDGLLMRIISGIASLLTLVAVQAVMYVWTKIGIWMVMKTSRDAEYEADAFSCDLGYSEGLLSFFGDLLTFEHETVAEGGRIKVFSALASSHPSAEKRIARIYERMGISS